MFRHPVIRWTILLAYMGLVYYLCLLPASSFKSNNFLDKIFFDKWVHVMMYFGVWTLLVWKFKGPGILIHNRKKVFMWSVIIVLFMGGSIEYLQGQTGRSMDWTDQLANFGGALLAWWFWIKFEHKWPMYKW